MDSLTVTLPHSSPPFFLTSLPILHKVKIKNIEYIIEQYGELSQYSLSKKRDPQDLWRQGVQSQQKQKLHSYMLENGYLDKTSYVTK